MEGGPERGITLERGLVKGQEIHSQNPARLIEKIIRERIFDSLYWKEQCFGLTAATLCDRAVEMTYIGGQYGQQRPTPFLCLAFKMIQLQPEKEIILEYMASEDFKYLRALAAFYIRLTYPAAEVYKLLEPLLADYHKLKLRNMNGFRLIHVDEFADMLLTEERVCDIALPRLPKRIVLEDMEELEPRESALGSELSDLEGDSDNVSDVESNTGVDKDDGEADE
ncbi:PRP38 family-domain-containing protein [Lipomyces tetrasporus]|uniref:Pre-mRNA-splicing factor 38 n=1 Tax=Lipomyces tetrasporus TaxID=54092 RepID=A0AAD7QUU2_9ASCO|nr:PRP38 family-domain-containing protein [Lipomyces tetrasporus]KAJ8101849.1 PRP38 family-domain-containing protein [Lipomyces tetrasporus]